MLNTSLNLRLSPGPIIGSLAILCATSLSASADVECGGDFRVFREKLEAAAVSRGANPADAATFFDGVSQDPAVLRADRRQGVFQLPFLEFSKRLISQNRLTNAARQEARYRGLFEQIESETGVPRGILLAFWAFETDFGAVQGDFNTVNALVTLAHDCRRPDLFRPHVYAALSLYRDGDLDPDQTTGAWAGEIGMVQMLPGDILNHGVDGDGDGHIRLKTSAADALFSGANLLRAKGWRPGEPWLREVIVPSGFDWSKSGLQPARPVEDWSTAGVRARSGTLSPDDPPARLLAPQGRQGPAFLAYPNLDVLFDWNQSFIYVVTTAYFATRIEGADVYRVGSPEPGLSQDQMRRLQEKLSVRGHDVGGVDGVLGAKTRRAVQLEQRRLGLPADAWPTQELLGSL